VTHVDGCRKPLTNAVLTYVNTRKAEHVAATLASSAVACGRIEQTLEAHAMLHPGIVTLPASW